MQTHLPRLILAGTSSGCGKTTTVCALLQALVNRNLKTGAFKCGPDYIDPMFHSRIIGAKSANLDLHFFSPNTLRFLLAKNGADRDISVIEGVMGYYDGAGLTSTKGSTYEVAQVTNSPVVLVVGAKGASLSVLATIQGFLDFCPDNHIKGVILNQCTAMTYAALSAEIEKRFKIRAFGFLPSIPACALESRHLGLVTAAEVEDLKEKMQLLAAQAEKSLNIDGLIGLANSAVPVEYQPVILPRKEPVRIAVARDKAFCFYYEDSLETLTEMGAELIPFSPLSDSELPQNIHGLYLGGGYPELYLKQLGDNTGMLHSIRQALERGLPCIAECGGFMYLTQSIAEQPMVGALEGECFNTGKLTRFGYVTLQAKKDNLLCKAGDEIAAHEFHHWDCTAPGDGFTAKKPTGKQWDCAVSGPTLYAGYPHFHFYSNPAFAEGFIDTCIKEKHRHD